MNKHQLKMIKKKENRDRRMPTPLAILIERVGRSKKYTPNGTQEMARRVRNG